MTTNQQGKPNRQEYKSINVTVLEILNTELGKVRQVSVNRIVYYLACDVCSVLGLPNATTVIKSISNTTVQNGPMKTCFKKFLENVNPYRKVHLISIEGVFEIILKNKSRKCLEIKEYFSMVVLPKCAGYMGSRSVDHASISSENGTIPWE